MTPIKGDMICKDVEGSSFKKNDNIEWHCKLSVIRA